ncbi:hypothetical protein M5K25_017561 [Dendrobium thyrsiflorum]|uniref:Uncharacterized protein n=1 Tax=Dendrobium thyrsiflorum TaxID=117978 RepID=A0ABD0UNC4_DENTH
MASRGLLQLMSYFTLSISLLLLIFALSSHQATASLSSSSTESITTAFETKQSTHSWPWDKWHLPKDWFKKSLGDIVKFLNKIRHRIIDEMLKILGLPPTGDILNFLFTAVKWLVEKLDFFIRDPTVLINTVIDWIVDSVMNPFRTLKDGMLSFRRLFRYLHKLKKGSFADFGKDNPVYKCYLEIFPPCVSQFEPSVQSQIVYHFYCAWIFYERCQLRFWWENGMWKVPMINGGDPCKVPIRHLNTARDYGEGNRDGQSKSGLAYYRLSGQQVSGAKSSKQQPGKVWTAMGQLPGLDSMYGSAGSCWTAAQQSPGRVGQQLGTTGCLGQPQTVFSNYLAASYSCWNHWPASEDCRI